MVGIGRLVPSSIRGSSMNKRFFFRDVKNLIGGEPEALYARARDVGTAFLRAEVLKDVEAAGVFAAGDSATERWIRR